MHFFGHLVPPASITLILLLGSLASASAATSEMEIVDEYLAQFDAAANAQGQSITTVQDRCQRTGGAEHGATIPQGGAATANNALMFQHVEWHGERGRFLEPAFTWSDSDPYGEEFIEFHADLIGTFEDWRALSGHPPLVPWDPMTPIPDEFAYETAPPCLARQSNDPKVAIPTFLTVGGGNATSPFWGYTSLCEFPDVNRLGKAMEASQYHPAVHNGVGGDMTEASLTLRDPVFWAWHSYLEGVHQAWQACEQQTDPAPAESEPAERDTPGIGIPLLLLVIGALAASRRRMV